MKAIIFDCETTGIDDPVIVQTAWADTDHRGQCEAIPWVEYWNPGKPISTGAMATHHIIDADVADKRPASEFSLPADVTYLIGHNIDFDWHAIGEPSVKRICTLALARHLWPDADSHTLGALIYRIQKPAYARDLLRGAHDAAVDVSLCGIVLREICAARQPSDLEDLWRMSEEARVPTRMPFGKHKGEPIASIPADYKAWLRRQPDVDPYLLKAISA